MGKYAYKFRGHILFVFALLLLLCPPYTKEFSVSGVLLILIAIAVRITARRSIGVHSRGKTLEAPRLVREGLYSRVRHPLYLSNGLMGSGCILLHLHWQNLTFVFLFTLWPFILFLAQKEDAFLKQEFGKEWEDFESEVPAFVPKLSGHSNKNYMQSRLQAFAGDLWTWIFMALFIVLLVFRRLCIF